MMRDAVRQTLAQREWIEERAESPTPLPPYGSHIGFQSPQLRGSLRLRLSRPFLLETCPGISEAGDLTEAYLQDWVGELCNLLIGRVKSKLLAHAIDLKLLPSPAAQEDDPLPWTFGGAFEEFTMKLKQGTDHLHLELRIQFDPTLDLACTIKPDPHHLQPGEAVFRLSETAQQQRNYDMIYKVRSGVDVDEEIVDELFAEEYPAPLKPYIPSVSKVSDETAPPLASPQEKQQEGHARLEAVDWGRDGLVTLRFSEKLSYRLCPRSLLADQSVRILLIEGHRLELSCDGSQYTLAIPSLQLTLSKSFGAA